MKPRDGDGSDGLAGTTNTDSWIQTYTGRQFWVLDPRPEDVCIEDIAHALSMACRYAGHVSQFYSVAQHSLMVSRLVPRKVALEALLHDAAEAYVADLPRPLKRGLVDYQRVEARVERAVAAQFGLAYPWPAIVKEVDMRILGDERRQLMAPPPAPWVETGEPLGVVLTPTWSPDRAEQEFLAEYRELVRKRPDGKPDVRTLDTVRQGHG